MAKKSALTPTIEESLKVGITEGERQTLEEISELLKEGMDITALKFYLKARLKSLNKGIVQTFKTRGS